MNGGNYLMKAYSAELKPIDRCFFREGYRFESGTSNWIMGLNHPYPSVIYGAIFTSFLRNGLFKDIVELIDEGKHLEIEDELIKKMKIDGIYLYNKETYDVLIPLPRDIFVSQTKKLLGTYSENKAVEIPIKNDEIFQSIDKAWMSLEDYINYYSKNKRISDIQIWKENDLFINYEKTGIEINKETGTAKEKYLYTLTMSEFKSKDYAYVANFQIDKNETLGINTAGIYRDQVFFGGESKLAGLKVFDKNNSSIIKLRNYEKDTMVQNGQVKIIFITPGIPLENFNIRYEVIGKPKNIGGYNMVSKRAKEIRTFIPAGSVYVIEEQEFKGKNLDEIRGIIEQKLEETVPRNLRARGYGNFLITKFDEKE